MAKSINGLYSSDDFLEHVDASKCGHFYKPTEVPVLNAKRGTLYDPKVADACLHLIRDKGFSFEENNKA